MKVIIKGILLDTIEKDYEFEGKKGVSYQLVIYQEGKLQNVKVPFDLYNLYKDELNKNIELVCDIFCKGSYSLSFKG